MADNKTNLNDLSEADTGELSESEVDKISGGQESQRLLLIDTIYSNGTKTLDIK